MTPQLRLTAGNVAAAFDPADGGRLTSFTIGGRELLVQSGRDSYHWGSFVIAPWVGRLRDGILSYHGQEYPFPRNSGPHAVHGLVTDQPWTMVGKDTMEIELNKAWPWPGRVRQQATLTEQSCEFRIEVHADEPMPIAVGWHPWFQRTLLGPDGTASAEIQLNVRPCKMYANDRSGLPSGELIDPVDRPWDYCFIDLAAPPVVRWPGTLELTVQSNCSHWVFYDQEEPGICIEPWTAPPNSLNMPNPTIVTPNRPLTAAMTWTWREVSSPAVSGQ